MCRVVGGPDLDQGVRMAVEELMVVVPPPKHPIDVGTAAQWAALEGALGTLLPTDYRKYIRHYGSGIFNDPGRFSLSIYNPVSPHFPWLFDVERLGLLTEKKKAGDRAFPYGIFPPSPGLFLWGNGTGGRLLWLTEGEPDRWPVLVCSPSPYKFERFDLPMTSFLAKVFSREIQCSIWSDAKLFSGPRKLKFAQSLEDVEYRE